MELNRLFHGLFETQKRPSSQDPRMSPGAQRAPSEGGIWPSFSVSFLILSLVLYFMLAKARVWDCSVVYMSGLVGFFLAQFLKSVPK